MMRNQLDETGGQLLLSLYSKTVAKSNKDFYFFYDIFYRIAEINNLASLYWINDYYCQINKEK